MQKHAHLNTEDENSPIYELAEHVILPEFGEIIVTPNPKFGEPSTWTNLEDFRTGCNGWNTSPTRCQVWGRRWTFKRIGNRGQAFW